MNTIYVGFADAIITPASINGMFLDGYGHRVSPAVGVRDDIHAKVMSVTDGENTHLLFTLDLIGLNQRLHALLASQISDLTGIPVSNISLVSIHTHAAPQGGILDEMPINTDYFAYVGELCGRAALRAMARACAGRFAAAVLPEQLTHAFNRRGRPYQDRRIKAAAFYDEDGALRGVITTAACHAVINTEFTISADWLAELNAISTDEIPYLFFQGRAADINPWQDEGMDADTFIATLGRELSEPAKRFATEAHIPTALTGKVTTKYEMVKIPMLAMDADELKNTVKSWSDQYFSLPIEDWNKHYYLRELQWSRHMLRRAQSGEGFDITVPLQLVTIGDAFAFAMVPFELLTLPGDRIEAILRRAGFPEEGIFVCGYANSVNGYLAPPEEFEVGGYEVGGAAHWYNIPQTSPDSEPAVVKWFEKNM